MDLPGNTEIIGTVIDERYRLVEYIGGGASGSVYLADDIQLQRSVAVKLVDLPPAEGEENMLRMQREAKALQMFVHPNIVQVFRVGRHSLEQIYLAMEYVPGESLQALLTRGGPLSFREAVTLSLQICAALLHAEKQGVVHRDVKPHNVLLFIDRETGERSAKLADFGLCKLSADALAEGNLTRTGVTLGTPQYMSPEQCFGQPVDARSDIYSFGCTLFEMLAGAPPFVADTPAGLLMKHVSEPPPRLSLVSTGSGMPDQLQKIYLRCMAKKPDDRYQSFVDVLADLEDAQGVAGAGRLMRESSDSLPAARENGLPKVLIACAALLALAGAALSLVFLTSPTSLAGGIMLAAAKTQPERPIRFIESCLQTVATVRGAETAKEVAEDTVSAADELGWSAVNKLALTEAHFEFFKSRGMNAEAAVFAERLLFHYLDLMSEATRKAYLKLYKDGEWVGGSRDQDLTPDQARRMTAVMDFFLQTDLPHDVWNSLQHRIGAVNVTMSPKEIHWLPPSLHLLKYCDLVVWATVRSQPVISKETAERLEAYMFESVMAADALGLTAEGESRSDQTLEWANRARDKIGQLNVSYYRARFCAVHKRMAEARRWFEKAEVVRKTTGQPLRDEWRLPGM